MKDIIRLFYTAAIVLFVASCSESDLSFTFEQAIGFSENTKQIRASDSDSVEINLALNSPLTANASVKINVLGVNGFVYGVDYTTEPAAESGQVELNLEAGATKGVIKYLGITKTVADVKTVLFQLESGSNISLGQASTLEFSLLLTSIEPIEIAHNFEDCTEDYSTPPGFTEVFVPGSQTDRGWGCRSNGVDGSRAVRASAFGGEADEDNAWLVMNPVNLSGYNDVNLAFDVNSFYDGPGQIIVQWSSDYDGSSDPTGFTWNILTDINSQFPAAGSDIWTAIDGAITDITGTQFYLAFQYKDGTSASSSSWDIDNLTLTGN